VGSKYNLRITNHIHVASDYNQMIHKQILERIEWFKELEQKCKEEIEDVEAARIVFRRLCFEEKK